MDWTEEKEAEWQRIQAERCAAHVEETARPEPSGVVPATFTHAEAHTIVGLLVEADEASEAGMPSGLDPEVRGHVGRLMAKVLAANVERP